MRDGIDDQWTVKMEELLPEPNQSRPQPMEELRRVAHFLRRVCMLYAVDYSCLPVQLPAAYFSDPTNSDCQLKAEFE